jgi:hypothetical protein
MSTKAIVLCLVACFAALSCAAQAGGDQVVPLSNATSPLGSSKGTLPGDACDPKTDGWMPAPLPPHPDLPQQIDQQVLLPPVPADYKAHAAPGEPYCAPDSNVAGRGFWVIDCTASGKECPSPSVCDVFGRCEVPCASDSDCVAPKRCEAAPGPGLRSCRCISCEIAEMM